MLLRPAPPLPLPCALPGPLGLSLTSPLTQFWLDGRFRREINTANPMGQKGALAIAFQELIEELWGDRAKVVAPTKFKRAIGKFAPRFLGKHASHYVLNLSRSPMGVLLLRCLGSVAIRKPNSIPPAPFPFSLPCKAFSRIGHAQTCLLPMDARTLTCTLFNYMQCCIHTLAPNLTTKTLTPKS